MKTYRAFDVRTNKIARLKRVHSECKCLGCFFLDEETPNCLAPMPIELGADCMEKNEMGGIDYFQFIEILAIKR